MNPNERWHRIQQLAELVEPLSPQLRLAQLETLEADPTIRAEVLDLLAALASEQQSRLASKTPPSVPASIPLSIGSYQILGRLGQGGTSTVYKAQQTLDPNAPPREVAIKVLNAYLSSPSRIERFQREYSILARLDHPGICRVLDSGITAEQQPFLVLELLDASPIDTHADKHRLNLAQRIDLAIQAADAMAHAHRNLIAHLDLKPGNLLVTSSGRVKVLDFGTAKILEPLNNLTTTRYLTPFYASPEQLRGDPLSTACDIYSLGLIVFELLAGASPFPATSIAGLAERASGATTARRLSERATLAAAQLRGLTLDRLRQQLSGDLELILARALAPEPERRYAAMTDFAEDLRRFLHQRPILARPQTISYRLSKFVRRNRASVALATLALIATTTSGTLAIIEQRKALAEGRRAQEISNFLGWLLHSANPQYGGRQGMTVLEMINRADSLVQKNWIQDDFARGYINTLIAGMLFESGGDAARGVKLLQETSVAAHNNGNPELILSVDSALANLLLGKGDCPATLKLVDTLDALLTSQRNKVSPQAWINSAVAVDAFRSMCGVKTNGQRIAEAITRLPEIPDNTVINGMPTNLFKALAWNAHANILIAAQKLPEAIAAVNEGIRYASLDPNGRNIHLALLQSRGRILYSQKDVAASASAYLEAATLAENSATPFEAIRLKVQAGQRLAEAGRKDDALRLADQAVALSKSQASALGDKRWMILIDAAITYSRLDKCDQTYALLAEADQVTSGKMPPAWKGNRFAFEASCLAKEGKATAAGTAAKRALDAAGSVWAPQASIRLRMQSLLATPQNKP